MKTKSKQLLKRMVTIMFIVTLIVTMTPFIPKVESEVLAATKPTAVSQTTVNKRINELSQLNNTYFTIDGAKASIATIDNTYNWSVLKKNSKVRNLIKTNKDGYIPTSINNLPTHYQGNYSITRNAYYYDRCCSVSSVNYCDRCDA